MTFEFTDIVLYILYLVVTIALAVIVWSSVRHVRKGGRSQRVVNRIPARRIAIIVFAAFFVIMGVSLMAALILNESPKFIVADMFIFTLVAMSVLAVAAVVFSRIKGRK